MFLDYKSYRACAFTNTIYRNAVENNNTSQRGRVA